MQTAAWANSFFFFLRLYLFRALLYPSKFGRKVQKFPIDSLLHVQCPRYQRPPPEGTLATVPERTRTRHRHHRHQSPQFTRARSCFRQTCNDMYTPSQHQMECFPALKVTCALPSCPFPWLPSAWLPPISLLSPWLGVFQNITGLGSCRMQPSQTGSCRLEMGFQFPSCLLLV